MKKEKYKEEQDCIDKGYKYLGWQVHSGNCEEIKKCHELGHYGQEVEDEDDIFNGKKIINRKVHEKSHNPRGSDNTHWCDECKIYWKIDCSD